MDEVERDEHYIRSGIGKAILSARSHRELNAL